MFGAQISFVKLPIMGEKNSQLGFALYECPAIPLILWDIRFNCLGNVQMLG